MKLSKLEPYLAVLLLVMVYVVSRQAGRMAAGVNVISGKERPVVVIDAGHGGNDPGKIGVDGSLEKDINLKIARKVKAYLEASDVQVVLTREDDQGLYTEKDSKKKMADMNRRCQIINETSPALTVSIHQNSYHQEGDLRRPGVLRTRDRRRERSWRRRCRSGLTSSWGTRIRE